MLIIVKYRDIHAALAFLLDVKTFRRADVLEIDPAESRRQRADDPDETIGVDFVDLDIKGVDVGKPLEQDGLAFHDRLGGEGADIAEPKHRRTVGNDADQVSLGGIFERLPGLPADGQARFCDARRIGHRKVGGGAAGLGGDDGQLARLADGVILEGPVRHQLLFHGGKGGDHGRQFGIVLGDAPDQRGVLFLQALGHDLSQRLHHLYRRKIMVEDQRPENRDWNFKEGNRLHGDRGADPDIVVEQRHFADKGARFQVGNVPVALPDFNPPG